MAGRAKAEAVVNRGQYAETYRTKRGAASSEKTARVRCADHDAKPTQFPSRRTD